MSISCLTCQPSPVRDYDPYGRRSPACHCCIGLDRSWSGGLTPPQHPYLVRNRSTRGKSGAKKNEHRKMPSTGSPLMDMKVRAMAEATMTNDGTPRLVRSGGMRRDWSFEDLKNATFAARKR